MFLVLKITGSSVSLFSPDVWTETNIQLMYIMLRFDLTNIQQRLVKLTSQLQQHFFTLTAIFFHRCRFFCFWFWFKIFTRIRCQTSSIAVSDEQVCATNTSVEIHTVLTSRGSRKGLLTSAESRRVLVTSIDENQAMDPKSWCSVLLGRVSDCSDHDWLCQWSMLDAGETASNFCLTVCIVVMDLNMVRPAVTCSFSSQLNHWKKEKKISEVRSANVKQW